MKLSGRGHRSSWELALPIGGWTGLAGLAASLQLMQGRQATGNALVPSGGALAGDGSFNGGSPMPSRKTTGPARKNRGKKGAVRDLSPRSRVLGKVRGGATDDKLEAGGENIKRSAR
jgi:hypothetical protein